MPKKKKFVLPIIRDKEIKGSMPLANGTIDGNFIKLARFGRVDIYVNDASKTTPASKIAFEVEESDDTPAKFKWIYQLLQGEPNFTSATAFPGKASAVGFNFPEILEGGGLAWIEPFLDAPKNKKPNGFFISAKGVTQKALSVKWRKFTDEHNGGIINETKQLLKNNVELHIYTQGIYGQEIEVTLFSGGEELGLYEQRPDENIQVIQEPGEGASKEQKDQIKTSKEKQEKEVAEIMAANKLPGNIFTRQVKAYKLIPDEQKLSTDEIISSSLTDINKAVTSPSSQKAILVINLDPLWRFSLGEGEHKIYPFVKLKINNKTKIFKGDYIIVDGEESKQPNTSVVGNQVITVSELPLNPARFELCKYSILKISSGDEEPVKIFAEEELSQTVAAPSNLTYGIIAGEDDAGVKVTLTVDGQNPNNAADCFAKPKHKGFVIDAKGLYAAGYKQETDKNKRPADKEEKGLKLKGSFRPFGGYTASVNNETKTVTNIVQHDDHQLVFDATYNYTITGVDGKTDYTELWKYIWLPKFSADAYRINTYSCRWKHVVDFVIYPDIKWTIGFKIGLLEDKFKKLNSDFKKVNTVTNLNPFEKAAVFARKKIDKFNRKSNAVAYKNGEYRPVIDDIASTLPKQRKPRKKDSFLTPIIKLLDEYEISIKGEWNNGSQQIDVVESLYQMIDNAIAGIKVGLEFVEDIIDGDTASPITLSTEKGNLVQKFIDKMTKKPVSYTIDNPSLGVAFAWYFENINNKEKKGITNWGAGITLATALTLDPAIGITVTLDFVQLLSRKHPIAFAIVAACKAIETLLGQDEDMVKIELKVTGKLTLEGNIKYNTISGFTMSTGKKAANNAQVIKGGAAITLSLEARIHLEGKVEIFYVAQVKAYVDAGVEGSVGVGLETVLGSDQEGMYVDLIGKFDGIKLKGDIKIDVSIKDKDEIDKEDSPPLVEAGFEIVLWEATHKFFTIRV